MKVCVQTHRAEQAVIVYTATDSVGHNSDAVLSQLCSEPLLIPLTRLPIEYFNNLMILWSSISFIIPNEGKQQTQHSHTFLAAVAFLQNLDGVMWCHLDLFWINWNALLSSGVMWAHVLHILHSSRSIESPRIL